MDPPAPAANPWVRFIKSTSYRLRIAGETRWCCQLRPPLLVCTITVTSSVGSCTPTAQPVASSTKYKDLKSISRVPESSAVQDVPPSVVCRMVSCSPTANTVVTLTAITSHRVRAITPGAYCDVQVTPPSFVATIEPKLPTTHPTVGV